MNLATFFLFFYFKTERNIFININLATCELQVGIWSQGHGIYLSLCWDVYYRLFFDALVSERGSQDLC